MTGCLQNEDPYDSPRPPTKRLWTLLIRVSRPRVCKFYWWVESLWLLLHKFWSHFGIFGVKYHSEKSHFQTFKHVVLACIHYREGYTKWLSWSADLESSNDGSHRVNFDRNLCTYQCKSREGGVRARGGDLMPETIPMLGFWSCEATPGSGHLTLTDRSLVSIQKRLPNPTLEVFWKSRCWRKVWGFHLF